MRTWQEAYRGLFPDEFLANLSVDRRTGYWETGLRDPEAGGMDMVVVAEHAREGLVGFASAGPNRGEEDAFQSELLTIYVLPAFQAQGLGHRLLLAISNALRERGYTSLIAWVLAANRQARAFYEALGGRLVGEKEETWGDQQVREVAYGWTSLPTAGEEDR